MYEIPQSLFDKYNDAVDAMINTNFGVDCKCVYPPLKTQCVNCVFDSIGRKSANKYAHGGPAPFNFGICPVCGGSGYRETESFDTIKLRVYYTPRDFKKISGNVEVPMGGLMVIGFLTDVFKLKNSARVIVNSTLEGVASGAYELSGEPQPWGFKRNRYFMAVLQRSS